MERRPDAEPHHILQALAENAANVCEADDALIHLLDDGVLRMVAHHGPIPSRWSEVPLGGATVPGRAILEQRVVQVEAVVALIIRLHAAQRMQQRYLDEWDVMRTIAFPDEVSEQDEVTVSKKTLGMKHVTVVWHKDQRGNVVVRTVI